MILLLSHSHQHVTLLNLSNTLRSEFGGQAPNRIRLSNMLDGHVLVYNHALTSDHWNSILRESGITATIQLSKEAQVC